MYLNFVEFFSAAGAVSGFSASAYMSDGSCNKARVSWNGIVGQERTGEIQEYEVLYDDGNDPVRSYELYL